MIFTRLLSLLFINCGILVSVGAQQPAPQPTPAPVKITANQQQASPDIDSQDVVRINTNLVQIDAVVTKSGKPITSLQPEDFEVFEDGKPQAITNFSYIANVAVDDTSKAATVPKAKGPKDKTAAPPVMPAKINPADQRRIMALVVDDLGMSLESITRIRKQIKKVLSDLSPNDLVAIIRTGGDIGSLQQFTNNRQMLQSTADRLQWNQCSRVGLSAMPAAGSEVLNTSLCAQSAISTVKAMRFILRGMSYLPGRKSMVLFSDSLPIEKHESAAAIGKNPFTTPSDVPPDTTPEYAGDYYGELQRLAELAIRASVVIYSVDTRGLETLGLTAADELSAPSVTGPNMSGILKQVTSLRTARFRSLMAGREGADLIARETGGFLVKDQNDLGLAQIMEDQQGYYLIGFRPTEETFNRKFHHIKVKVKPGGLSVRTREGFYGFTDAQVQPTESVTDQINHALISPFGANQLTVRLSTLFVDDAASGPLLRSFVYLNARDLTFTDEADGSHVAHVDLRGMLFGDNGKVLDQKNQTGTLRFRGEEYERALHQGFVYGFDLAVKQPGALQFRVAVRDSASSHIGTAGQFIQVPDLQRKGLAMSGIFARGLSPGRSVPASTGASATIDASETAFAGPGMRKFRQGSTVIFGYAIYNARVESGTILNTQMRIFRDGKLVFVGDPRPVDPEGTKDPQRIIGASALQLGSEMTPGEYIVQITAANSSNGKSRTVSQWIDFEVLK